MSWTGRTLDSIVKADGTQIAYTYDLDGIRTKKVVNGITTEYFVSGSTILAEKTGDNVIWYIYDGGEIVGFIYNDIAYYYVKNIQGDVMMIMTSYGMPVASYEYDPWGKVISSTGTMAQINPIRYRSYYYDNETGMYYLNSRYYNPEVGRFVNCDGYVATGQGITSYNMFAYCLNNPVNMSDESGRFALFTILVVSFVVSVAAAPLVMYGGECVGSMALIAGSEYLKSKGYDLAESMYSYAYMGSGKKMEYSSLPSMMEEKLISSTVMHEILDPFIKGGKNFDTGDKLIEFIIPKDSNNMINDTDLFYSIQHAYFRAWGWKESDGRWKVNVIMWDKYDFDKITYGFSLADAANTLGYIMQDINQIKEYRWWIRYEYYY
ncbi:MAG: RHS repeat-associated core domain-containing protein [Clostridia bacterium]|nr:RHS repeat-associated core domain-containing protein [Clostridia bacterium]